MKKNKEPSLRQTRVNELIKRTLSDVILKEGIPKELVGNLISISSVDISPDFKNAIVFFSIIGSDVNIKSACKLLNDNMFRYQSIVASKLRLPKFPKMIFKYDDSFVNAQKIEKLIKKT